MTTPVCHYYAETMLADIDTWVLDLDDTLYPPGDGLADHFDGVCRRSWGWRLSSSAARPGPAPRSTR